MLIIKVAEYFCGGLTEAEKRPSDAPLVEAPSFMAPPRDRRGLPMHYFPPRPRSAFDPALQPARALMERGGSLVHGTLSLAGLRPARGRVRAA